MWRKKLLTKKHPFEKMAHKVLLNRGIMTLERKLMILEVLKKSVVTEAPNDEIFSKKSALTFINQFIDTLKNSLKSKDLPEIHELNYSKEFFHVFRANLYFLGNF